MGSEVYMRASRATLQYPAFFMIGFSSLAPHVLIGLAARELVPASQSSTAGGLVTMVSRTGGALAGAPIGFLADKYGWEGLRDFRIGRSADCLLYTSDAADE